MKCGTLCYFCGDCDCVCIWPDDVYEIEPSDAETIDSESSDDECETIDDIGSEMEIASAREEKVAALLAGGPFSGGIASGKKRVAGGGGSAECDQNGWLLKHPADIKTESDEMSASQFYPISHRLNKVKVEASHGLAVFPRSSVMVTCTAAGASLSSGAGGVSPGCLKNSSLNLSVVATSESSVVVPRRIQSTLIQRINGTKPPSATSESGQSDVQAVSGIAAEHRVFSPPVKVEPASGQDVMNTTFNVVVVGDNLSSEQSPSKTSVQCRSACSVPAANPGLSADLNVAEVPRRRRSVDVEPSRGNCFVVADLAEPAVVGSWRPIGVTTTTSQRDIALAFNRLLQMRNRDAHPQLQGGSVGGRSTLSGTEKDTPKLASDRAVDLAGSTESAISDLPVVVRPHDRLKVANCNRLVAPERSFVSDASRSDRSTKERTHPTPVAADRAKTSPEMLVKMQNANPLQDCHILSETFCKDRPQNSVRENARSCLSEFSHRDGNNNNRLEGACGFDVLELGTDDADALDLISPSSRVGTSTPCRDTSPPAELCCSLSSISIASDDEDLANSIKTSDSDDEVVLLEDSVIILDTAFVSGDCHNTALCQSSQSANVPDTVDVPSTSSTRGFAGDTFRKCRLPVSPKPLTSNSERRNSDCARSDARQVQLRTRLSLLVNTTGCEIHPVKRTRDRVSSSSDSEDEDQSSKQTSHRLRSTRARLSHAAEGFKRMKSVLKLQGNPRRPVHLSSAADRFRS